MRQFLAFLLSFTTLHSATLTVGTSCTPACDYTAAQLQTALNAAVGGDIIEIKYDEDIQGAFTLPFRSESGRILLRSSRYKELPPVGTRVSVADAALMPKLRATNTTSPVLTGGFTTMTGSSVNTSTDVITFATTVNIPNGSPFVCRYSSGGSGPVTAYTIYYARDVSGSTMKVAATSGGAALDLTTAITGTMECTRNESIRGWQFQGIEFAGKSGSPSVNALVHISSDANDRAGLPSDIHLDRVYIHGLRDEDGARNCLVMNARKFSITDSRLEFCKQLGVESHAISMVQAPGPGLIRNNYLDGASENILFGGDFKRITGIVNGDEGGIEIVGNHLFKPLYLKYLSGAGQDNDPVQSCSGAGQYSLNTLTGLLFKCKTANTWTLNPTCANDEYFRQTNAAAQNCAGGACWKCAAGVYVPDTVYRSGSYFVKNSYECKNCININFHGNVAENNWSGNGDQSGVAIWVVSQNDNGNGNEWVRGENLRFHNNIIKNSEMGFRVTTNGSNVYGLPNKQVHVYNNALIGIGATAYPSIPDQNSTTVGSSFEVGGRCENCSWNHNSSYNATSTNGRCVMFDTSPVINFFFGNNICGRNLYGVNSGSAGPNCAGIAATPVFWDTSDGLITNNALIDNQSGGSLGSIGSCATLTNAVSGSMTTHFTSSTDLRLKTTSPYSAANASPTYIATDGTDLGADMDKVEAETSGAVSGLPTMHNSIKVNPSNTKAIISYKAPDASACTLKLYTGVGARLASNLHADTADSAKWADDRSGNLFSGRNREFTLGTVSALTASTSYQAVINCSGTIGYTTFRTLPAGSGYNAVIRYSSARTGEYSASAAFSSPTAISSSATHTVPVGSGAIVYYRYTGGPTKVLTSR